jgi:hypothetical protein
MFTRVMMRPRPQRRRVEPVAAKEETEIKSEAPAEFSLCAGCVTKKLCREASACMYGGKKPKGKRANGRDGRLPT